MAKGEAVSESETKLFFSYGSNMDEAQMIMRCPDAEPRGTASLDGYRFIINARGVATAIPDPDSLLRGVLWGLGAEDEESLDRYEGVGYGTYAKEVVTVQTDSGEAVDAITYLATGDTQTGSPSFAYGDRIIRAAVEQGLPAEYIEELRAAMYAGG